MNSVVMRMRATDPSVKHSKTNSISFCCSLLKGILLSGDQSSLTAVVGLSVGPADLSQSGFDVTDSRVQQYSLEFHAGSSIDSYLSEDRDRAVGTDFSLHL